MSNEKLQAARTIAQVNQLDFNQAVKPGSLLTIPSLSQIGIDITGYDTRDRELAYRDIALATALQKIARQASTIFNCQVSAVNFLENLGFYETEVTTTLVVTSNSFASTLSGPATPGKLTVSFEDATSIDDFRGNLLISSFLVNGTIDYSTGVISGQTTGIDDGKTVTVSWKYVTYLEKNTSDLNADQEAEAPGGFSGVRYVNNSSVVRDAQLTDRDIYRRDLILYEVLYTAGTIFKELRANDPFQTPTATALIPSLTSGVTLGQNWSRAEGTKTTHRVKSNELYSPELYNVPDKGLTYRDNILAKYIAEISNLLKFSSVITSNLQYFITENDIELLSETSTPTVGSTQLQPEQDIFEVFRSGTAEFFEKANILFVRVKDPNNTPSGLLWDNGGTTTDRINNREPEQYIIVEDTPGFRRFASLPQLANNRLSILYNRANRTLRWSTEDPALIHRPQPSAPIIQGLRNSQSLEFIVAIAETPDSSFYLQKAAQYRATGIEESIVEQRTFNILADSTEKEELIATDEVTIIDSTRGCFTEISEAQWPTWSVVPNANTDKVFYQFNLLLDFARTIQLKAATYDSEVSNPGSFTTGGDDSITLPAPDITNRPQAPANTPNASWSIILPTGVYKLSFTWQDTSINLGQYNVAIRYNNLPISFDIWQATDVDIDQTSTAYTLVIAEQTQAALSLILDSMTDISGGLKIISFKLVRTETPPVSDFRFNLTINDTDNSQIGSTYYFRFSEIIDNLDVISTPWIDSHKLTGNTQVNLNLRLLDSPTVPIAVKAIDLRKRYAIKKMPDGEKYLNVRNTLLKKVLDCLVSKYTQALIPGTLPEFRGENSTWTADSTAAWLTSIETYEPRLTTAFRDSLPGDLGKPALVPAGLELLNSGTVINSFDATKSIPTLQVLQSWMVPLGIKVAGEAFWTVTKPSPPAIFKFYSVASGEITGEAGILDFSNKTNSQYLII